MKDQVLKTKAFIMASCYYQTSLYYNFEATT